MLSLTACSGTPVPVCDSAPTAASPAGQGCAGRACPELLSICVSSNAGSLPALWSCGQEGSRAHPAEQMLGLCLHFISTTPVQPLSYSTGCRGLSLGHVGTGSVAWTEGLPMQLQGAQWNPPQLLMGPFLLLARFLCQMKQPLCLGHHSVVLRAEGQLHTRGEKGVSKLA